MKRIIIATIKSWNIANSLKFKAEYSDKYEISLITKKEDFNIAVIQQFNPHIIFFPHWSWIIPEEIYNNYECVVFHMTDLPYGRGGSPLQNLIVRKNDATKISAIRVQQEIDAGKIYVKEDFHIGIGSAEEILMNASDLIFSKMMPYILENSPLPLVQVGSPVYFKRRTPEESDISQTSPQSLSDLYDFIRMLDAEDYPSAFIKLGRFKILFSEVHKKSDKLVGRFDIIEE